MSMVIHIFLYRRASEFQLWSGYRKFFRWQVSDFAKDNPFFRAAMGEEIDEGLCDYIIGFAESLKLLRL